MALARGVTADGRMPRRDSPVLAAAGLLVLVIMMLIAFPGRSAAAGGVVTLHLLPAGVTMSPGEPTTVSMVISNGTSAPVRVTAVDVSVPAQVVAENVPPPECVGQIRAGGFVTCSFVLLAGAGVENGEVDVLVRYRSGSGRQAADRVVTASLALTAGHAPPAPQAAFLSFPDKLNDGQSAEATVSISNPALFPVNLIQVSVVNSENITLSRDPTVTGPFAACPGGIADGTAPVGCLDTLAPGATAVLYLKMTASSRVQTGTQRVSVIVSSQTDASGDLIPSTVVATTPVQVAIFGVDALSPFGLGTLFILPGIVTVLTFLALARNIYPRSKELPDSVSFTDARTMLAVVPPAALIYLLVWAILGVNLMDAAGTWDVARLFGWGLAVGFAVWVVVARIYYLRSGRKQFTVSDTPQKALERMHARGMGLTLPVVVSGNIYYRYLSDGPSGQLFACPPVTYAFASAVSDDDEQRFRAALGAGAIDKVLSESRLGTVSLDWQRTSGVTLLETSAVQIQDKDLLLEETLPGGS
jgi:hypothetical protein